MTRSPTKLRVITETHRPMIVEEELRVLLADEAELERRLVEVRAKLGGPKRTYQEKYKTYGLSNEALRRELGI